MLLPPLHKTEEHTALAIAAHPWTSNLFHAVFEMLSRVAIVHTAMQDDANIKLLLPAGTHSFSLALLELMGLGRERLVLIDNPRRAYFARTLLVPRGVFCGAPMGGQLRYTRKQVTALKLLQLPQSEVRPTQDSVVFLRRSKCLSRHIANLDELIAVVRKEFPAWPTFVRQDHGPSVLVPVREIVQLMQRAYLVVACHGSGLVNTLFARPGTHVLEYLVRDPRGNGAACYAHSSALLQLRHRVVFPPALDTAAPGILHADLDEFRRQLREVLVPS